MVSSISPVLTPVENRALADSPFGAYYPPTEKATAIVVANFPALGKLAAMRFIEWVQDNPAGVISLPTGKTPEHFIRWVTHTLSHWDEEEVRGQLEDCGIDPAKKPRMDGLHFVQIDEFYPIDPRQHNSFFDYVNRFYIDGFGLDPQRALLIDCNKVGLLPGQSLKTVWPDNEVDLSLRYRAAVGAQEQVQQDALSRIDQWCHEYEERIRALGGIGFFLGGIGPDGHIGFNVRGSDHFSVTRLAPTNYETQAAAAGDLGGIEISRHRLVITIGLGTITYKPDGAAIIIAAGEAKAGIVADALQQQAHIGYPATALHVLPNARFYLTLGAAKKLESRQLERVKNTATLDDRETEKILVDICVALNKSLTDLTQEDVAGDPFGALVLNKRSEPIEALAQLVRQRLIGKIERGIESRTDTRFLHTEPHHDDLMLGYWPHIVRHVRHASNTHFFSCLTSGFTAVTNRFIEEDIERLHRFVDTADFAELLAEDYFAPDNLNGRNRDVWQYLDGVAASDTQICDEGMARRFLRDLIGVYGDSTLAAVKERLVELEAYFSEQYPGQKDSQQIQQLKGMRREFEAECTWGYLGWDCASVRHLRLGFYTGDIFTAEPTEAEDVLPVLALLREVEPDVVGVALDPEASGPDTHYKVLQAITAALRRYVDETGRRDIKVWGYRNVWFRFHPSEANIFVPVSLNMLAVMHNAFMSTFNSQKNASFPSYEHDGPFSELARRVQVEQYQAIKLCLGRKWFQEHPSPLMRATRGFVFLDELELGDFYQRSMALKQAAENR